VDTAVEIKLNSWNLWCEMLLRRQDLAF
jgi:hypothetical protein